MRIPTPRLCSSLKIKLIVISVTYVYEQLDEVFKICRHYANEAGDDPRDTYRVFNLSKCKQVNAPETVTRILHLYAKIYCLLNDLNSHNRTHVIEKKIHSLF